VFYGYYYEILLNATNGQNIKQCFNILLRVQYIFVKYHKDIKIFVKFGFSGRKVLIFYVLRIIKLKGENGKHSSGNNKKDRQQQ